MTTPCAPGTIFQHLYMCSIHLYLCCIHLYLCSTHRYLCYIYLLHLYVFHTPISVSPAPISVPSAWYLKVSLLVTKPPKVAADSGVGLTAPPLYGSPTGQHLTDSRKQEHTWQHWAPTLQSYSAEWGAIYCGDSCETEKVLICVIARI